MTLPSPLLPISAGMLIWTLTLGGSAWAWQPPEDATQESATQDSSEADSAPSPEVSDYTAVTTLDPQIPLDQLEILVKPLTKSELEVETKAWMKLLRQKAKQIAAIQLGIKKTNEAIGAGDGAAAESAIKAAIAVKQKADQDAAAAEQQLIEDAQQQLGLDGSADDTNESTEPAETSDASADESNETGTGGDLVELATTQKNELLVTVAKLQEERTSIADRLEIVLTSLEAKGGDIQEYRNYATAVSGIDLDATDASATWAAITSWLVSKEGGQRWAWNLGLFVLFLCLTVIVAKVVARVVEWLLEGKVRMTQLAENLISRTIKNVVLVVGFTIALTALEIDITPIIAAIGAAGFIIGFALQGTLSNFASGLMILINRPFDVGDVVTAAGITGTIRQMNLVSTTFRTFDNQTIHVPNNSIWGNVITNITANENRRVDLEFGIGYEDDFEEAERIITEVVKAHELVLDDPEPAVVMHALADSSVQIVCRPWAKTSDWWTVKTDITRQVKKRFDEAGISIPFPQRDIHVYQHEPPAGQAGAKQAGTKE